MIKTENLEIVPLDMTFSEEIFQLWGDYEVIKYTYNKLMKTPDDCRIRLMDWLQMNKDNSGPNKFAILLSGKMIGIIGYPVVENENFQCGFFYQIVKSYWGKGYRFEAAKAVLTHIYKVHVNANVIADAVTANPASINILLKLGFLQTDLKKNEFESNGMKLDICHFIMNRDTFEQCTKI
jgi:ribosomal-protein-alanine N-acetyltransferase